MTKSRSKSKHPKNRSKSKKSKSRSRSKHSKKKTTVWRWWSEKGRRKTKGGAKWRTLRHNGPAFAPEYRRVPSDVRLYYDGRSVRLSKAAEEVAGFYGKMLNESYTKKTKFNRNFIEDWRQVMNARERRRITDIRKCDFEDFYDFYQEEKERKKSKEEKKRLKREREKEAAKYGFCVVDGHVQKVTNFRLEPPGLFRGRGNHPQMGRLKRRVEADDVTLNIGKGAPVPRPPRGQRWGEVIHDNTVIWLASWIDGISGKVKYIRMSPSSKFKGQSDIEKYEMARELSRYIAGIRRHYERDLDSEDPMERQRAVAMYFIDKLALRIGNEKGEGTADTVGCCSLRVEHVTPEGGRGRRILRLDFPGKDCIRYKRSVPVGEAVFQNLREFAEGKRRKSRLFDLLTPTLLNRYLSEECMEGLTAKVFRTHHASKELERKLKANTKKSMSVARKLASYAEANVSAAVLCNHQRAIPKSHAKSMRNLEKKIKEKRKKERDLLNEMDRSGTKSGKSKQKKKLTLLRKQIEQLQLRACLKEHTKDVALSTSKFNYLDPRITVAWCLKYDVPLNKVFSKAQQERFQWAIETTNRHFKF